MTAGTGAPPTSQGRDELLSIQTLRGIAALLVIYHHAHEQFGSIEKIFPSTFGAGGVDLFFVISGFVMIYTTSKRKVSPSEFLLKRVTRIAPLYWLMTLLTAALLVTAGSLVDNSVYTTGSLVQSLIFLPHRNPADFYSFSPMLKLGWTLNYEMFFYAIFSAVLFLSNSKRLIALFIVFSLLVWFAKSSGTTFAPILVWGNTIVFEFLFGCAIGALDVSKLLARVNRPAWLSLLAVGAILFVLLADAPGVSRPLSRGLPSAIVVIALVGLERQGNAAVMPLLKLLGDASYSIYLSHLYVVILFRVVWKKLSLPIQGVLWSTTFIALCMILGGAAGIFTFKFVEAPLGRIAARVNRRLLNRRPKKLATAS